MQLCVYPVWPIGEELLDFWILAEKILSIDETDVTVRDYYLSLLFLLKATHLQEGSSVVTLCNMNISKNYSACARRILVGCNQQLRLVSAIPHLLLPPWLPSPSARCQGR